MFTKPESLDSFLRDYWQRKPCLLKQALRDFTDPISPEELAGLACEEFAESRLVRCNDGQWHVEHGPFPESLFTGLPEQDWTVLVQRVDHFFPSVRSLLELVPFIPRWRIDDIMVSYAEPGGGVGPHFDYYDVFIIQGQGCRRWQTGQACTADDLLDTASGMKILRSFEPVNDWLLEPGDVLYIPPGIAHQGSAVRAGLNYSIGFRAPSLSEIVIGFSDDLAEKLSEDQRYRDPAVMPDSRPGEISTAALQQLETLISAVMQDKAALADWFGRYMTEPLDPLVPELPDPELSEQELLNMIRGGAVLIPGESCRFAFLEQRNHLRLFALGHSFLLDNGNPLHRRLAESLGKHDPQAEITALDFTHDPICLHTLTCLYNQGALLCKEGS